MAATRLAHPATTFPHQSSRASDYCNSVPTSSFCGAAVPARRPFSRVTAMALPPGCGGEHDESVSASFGEGSDQDTCVLRVMRPSVYEVGRVNVPGELAKVLHPNIDDSGSITIAINAAASHPQHALPAQCTLGHRLMKSGSYERFLHGLAGFLRANDVQADLDLILLSSVTPPASSSSGGGSGEGSSADRPQLAIRIIRDGDLPSATLYNLRKEMARGRAWVGSRAALRAFVGRVGSLPLTEGPDAALGAAAGAVPLQRKRPERPNKEAPKPEPPEAAAERFRRRQVQQQREAGGSSGRLRMMGLSEEIIQVVAAWGATPLGARVCHQLRERAFRYGKVNVRSDLAQLFCSPSTPGVKPEPVTVPVHTVSYSQLLPHVTFRGSPRAGKEGRVEWTVNGLGKWLKGSGAVDGDVLLVWVEQDEQQGGKGELRLHMHLLVKADMGEHAWGAVVAELGSSV